MYSLGQDENGLVGLYRITVEDMFQGGRIQNDYRFHNLKYIEKVADLPGRLTDGNQARRAKSPNSGESTTEYTVADLYRFVKEYDNGFRNRQYAVFTDVSLSREHIGLNCSHARFTAARSTTEPMSSFSA